MSEQPKLIVVGFDQSYTDTGICVRDDSGILVFKSIDYKGLNTKTQKRNELRKRLPILFDKLKNKYDCPILCIIERTRTFSNGFMSTAFIHATGALNATIVDIADSFGIEVYSVDTRAWKAQVLGSAKSIKQKQDNKSKSKNKQSSIDYVLKTHNIDVSYINKRGNTCYNDNIADAICIADYGFIPKSRQNLKKEL